MGRRKFRLSDMMSSCWFCKPRDMRRAGVRFGSGGASVTHQSSSLGAKGITQPAGTPTAVPVAVPHRTSYYYASRDWVLQPSPAPQPTRAATEDRHPRTSRSYNRQHRVGPVGKAVAPLTEAPDAHRSRRRPDTCVGRDGGSNVGTHRRPAVKAPSSSRSVFTRKVIATDTDIIFDLRAEDMLPESVLPPIVTKPTRREINRYDELRGRHVVHHAAATPIAGSASEQGGKGSLKRSSVSSGRRHKTRANSPRLASLCRTGNKSTNPAPTPAASPRKATPAPLAESFAVVKTSFDPRNDFRESMEEMIAEKGIRDAGDLEDLLACYLALNAAEHHDLIVEVFEEIWATLASFNP